MWSVATVSYYLRSYWVSYTLLLESDQADAVYKRRAPNNRMLLRQVRVPECQFTADRFNDYSSNFRYDQTILFRYQYPRCIVTLIIV